MNYWIFIIDAVYILKIWTVNPDAQAATFVVIRIQQPSLEKLFAKRNRDSSGRTAVLFITIP